MPDLVPVKRALLSVSDKTGLVDFGKSLHQDFGVELISTGGTAKVLREAGLPVTDVSQVTGFPEMMDGRVKTLHPKIHGGLLALRDNPEHAAAMREHGIKPIDLVCINLYPFEQTVKKPGVTFEEAVENIDIGGPSMIRSAAKNHRYVLVVTSPERYEKVLGDLREHNGSSCGKHRLKQAQRAFAHTAEYDSLIANYLATADVCVVPDPKNPVNDLCSMNKIVEYMAMGKPVVAFDLKEARETAREAGVYVTPNGERSHDAAAFGDQILTLLDSPQTRAWMGRLGRRRFTQVLAWDHQQAALLQAYAALFPAPLANNAPYREALQAISD